MYCIQSAVPKSLLDLMWLFDIDVDVATPIENYFMPWTLVICVGLLNSMTIFCFHETLTFLSPLMRLLSSCFIKCDGPGFA